MGSEPDPSRCPLCGSPNGCAMAAGNGAAACWCMELEIPRDVLARIPETARDRACVCAACARGEGTRETTVSPKASRRLRTVAR